METKEAFKTLLMCADAALEKTQAEGAAYFANGDMVRVLAATDRVEKIKGVLNAVYDLQDHWNQIFLDAEPEIPPKIIKEDGPKKTPPGKKTHQKHYWVPILRALVEMGGSGQNAVVVDRVGEIMVGILNDFDRGRLKTKGIIRWRNTAMWARNDMITAGYLRKNSPHGIWEITEEGRKYLQENGSKV